MHEDDLMLDQQRISDRLVALIDTFFGVVLGVSVTAIFGEDPLNSCPTPNELITLPNMALVVAYTAIVLSWLGYHIMIEENPFKLNRWGYLRFFSDIFIVFMYTALIYSRNYLVLFLFIFPAIFLFYIIGGIFRNKEYGEKVSKPILSLKYLIFFLLTAIIYKSWSTTTWCWDLLSLSKMSWIVLFINLLLLIRYRIERDAKRRNALPRSS